MNTGTNFHPEWLLIDKLQLMSGRNSIGRGTCRDISKSKSEVKTSYYFVEMYSISRTKLNIIF